MIHPAGLLGRKVPAGQVLRWRGDVTGCKSPPPPAATSPCGDCRVELETNLREVLSFTITERAPTLGSLLKTATNTFTFVNL